MDFFKKLPESTRYPIGIEWPLLKKIPWIFLIGTLLITSPAVNIYLKSAEITAAQYKTVYICLGALFTYWFFVGVVAIACVLIMLMKGPGYVADAYELPKEDKRLENRPDKL
jgi:uncharacterized membrane protein